MTQEGALHLDDLLARRTRISIETPDRGLAAAEAVAAVVGPRLGWDQARTADERSPYRSRLPTSGPAPSDEPWTERLPG